MPKKDELELQNFTAYVYPSALNKFFQGHWNNLNLTRKRESKKQRKISIVDIERVLTGDNDHETTNST